MRTITQKLCSRAMYLRRVLMLAVMLAFLCSGGVAADNKVVIDGVTYYYGDFSGKNASLTKKYGKEFALVGVTPVYSRTDFVTYNMLPQLEQIRILPDVTVGGKTYPVVAFYDGNKVILGDLQKSSDGSLYSEDGGACYYESVTHDVYFSRFYPLSFGTAANTPNDGTVFPNAVAHVPDSLMDKIIAEKVAYVRVTDGNRWYFNDPDNPDNSYATLMRGKAAYLLYYPADQSRHATCEYSKYMADVTIPSSVNDGYKDIPVTSANFAFDFNGRNLYLRLQKLIDINESALRSIRMVVVPSDLYDAALDRFGKASIVTDGKRVQSPNTVEIKYTDEAGFVTVITANDGVWAADITAIPNTEKVTIPSKIVWHGIDIPVTSLSFTTGGYKVKEVYFGDVLPKSFSLKYTDEEGFATALALNDGVWSADITALPDTETVTIPSKIVWSGIDIPVTSLSFKTCGDNVKDIYFGDLWPTEKDSYDQLVYAEFKGKNVRAHVPDTLFERALLRSNVKVLLSDSRKALNSNLFPQSGPGINTIMYYDYDGDGRMEFLNSQFYGYYDYDDESYFYRNKMSAVSMDGDEVYTSGKKWPALYNSGNLYGYFSLLSRGDKPYLVSGLSPNAGSSGAVYDMSGDMVFDAGDKSLTAAADINGDGCKELLGSLGNGTDGYYDIVRMLPDGTFAGDKIYVTSDTTALGDVINDYTPNSGVITKSNGAANAGSLADGMFVKVKQRHLPADSGVAQTYSAEALPADSTGRSMRLVREGNQIAVMSMADGAISASDYNGDGLVDLNDGKYIYYNLGGNRFFRSPHKGTVYSADITGDGLLDYIDFSNNQIDLYVTKPDGSMGEPKTLLKNQAVKSVFFGDFDRDGDIDILLFVGGTDYTLFQFYRNDGNGTFRAKDDNVDGLYRPVACCDYDGDGLYEILAYVYDSSNRIYYYYLFKIGKNWSVTRTDLPADFNGIANLNNDGMMTMAHSSGWYNVFDNVPGAVRNTRPEKMAKPSAVAFPDANRLKISWTRGSDNETSPCDLTYELRIGTAPGKGDIYYGNANADGTRRMWEDGSMGRSLSYMYDTGNLVEGKYYIAVQAVDAGQLGGAWSDELVYDHKLAVPVIAPTAGGTTADSITLAVQNPVAAATYEWHIDKASVVKQNASGSVAKAVFTESGKHTFSVSMTAGGTTVKSASATVDIAPAKSTVLKGADGQTLSGGYSIDIDQDGNAEIFGEGSPYSGSGFYERKSDGTYASIRKLWNTNLERYKTPLYSDFNRDGYPDFMQYSEGTAGSNETFSGKMFFNSGEGDKSFDSEEFSYEEPWRYYTKVEPSVLVDWNNDGKFAAGKVVLLADKDGNLERKVVNIGSRFTYYNRFYDFDRDGAVDLWTTETNTDVLKAQTKVYFNNVGASPDLTFADEGKVYYENSHQYWMSGFADFNNDGYADGYFFDDGKLVIVKGRPVDEWPCTETVAIPVGGSSNTIALLDVNNDGYLDILKGGDVLLMGKDFTVTRVDDGSVWNSCDEHHWQPLTPGAYPNGIASNIANAAPSVPANVTVQNVNQGNMLIKWDDSTDDRTPWAQMRYNISVKEKGKTGAGAFVLSPMNGLSDEAAILSGIHYRKATQITVPKHVFTEGATYEVQVQAIDLMGEHSAMSKPVEFVYNRYNYIDVNAEKLYTGIGYSVRLQGSRASKVTCTAGDDAKVTEVDAASGAFTVQWAKPGTKTIAMTDGTSTVSATVSVKDRPSLAIQLPQNTMLNSPLTVRVPDVYASSMVRDVSIPVDDNYSVSYEYGDSTATFVFTHPGTTVVKVQGTLVGVSEKCVDQTATEVVDQVMPTARIASVESDGRNYRVNWTADAPPMVTRVEIARETNRLGQFETLDIVPVTDATWCDLTSDNRIQPQRYRIRLLADNGVQTSDWSESHNPLHVDINKTADGRGNNLMWNAYEGLDVDSYTILRGTSAGKLRTIATVPGTQLNYTDADAPEGVCFYAVRFNEVRAMVRGVKRVQQLDDKVQSNVISSEEAMPTIAATDISIVTVERAAVLNGEQPQLHLSAVIIPTYATYNRVGWTVVSGGEYATVASNGLLTATGGKGDVVVRVTTLDGSGLSAEITVPCDYSVLAKSIGIYRPKSTVSVGESIQLEAILLPRNVSMKNVVWESLDEQVATVDAAGVLKGVAPGSAVVKATTADGTLLMATVRIEVIDPTGIRNVSDGDDADLQYFTVDGKKVDRPVKGEVYITNKGYKVLYR